MAERRVVTKTDFLSDATASRRVDVPVPELGEGCVIPVWQMTSREKTLWEQSFSDSNSASVRERLVLAVCRDDSGVSLFTSDDIPELAKRSAKVMDRIVQVARDLNEVTDDDIKAMEKN